MRTAISTPTEAESSYYEWQQKKADDVDTHVAYMQNSTDNWGMAPPLNTWGETTATFTKNAVEYGYSSEDIENALEILTTGTFGDRRIDIDDIAYKTRGRNYEWPNGGSDLKNATEAYMRRLFYAYLATRTPSDFKVLQEEDIVAFHGTQATGLPFILETGGLLSHADQARRNILTGSGEPYPVARRREFVSFGALHHTTGLGYAESDLRSVEQRSYLTESAERFEGYQMRLEELKAFDELMSTLIESGDEFLKYTEAHHFGAVFGLSRRALWSAGVEADIGRRVEVSNDPHELSFAHSVGLAYLPVLLAPEEHAPAVREIIPPSIKVLAKESIARAIAFAEGPRHLN